MGGKPCNADSQGLLQRYPVTASEFILIGQGNRARLGAGGGYQHLAAGVDALRPKRWHRERTTPRAPKQVVPEGLTEGNRFEQEYHPSRTAGEETASKIAQRLRVPLEGSKLRTTTLYQVLILLTG